MPKPTVPNGDREIGVSSSLKIDPDIVTVTVAENYAVVTFGRRPSSVTLVGHRDDVENALIEAHRQILEPTAAPTVAPDDPVAFALSELETSPARVRPPMPPPPAARHDPIDRNCFDIQLAASGKWTAREIHHNLNVATASATIPTSFDTQAAAVAWAVKRTTSHDQLYHRGDR